MGCHDDTTPQDRPRLHLVLITGVIWVVCLLGASRLIPQNAPKEQSSANWLLAFVPVVAGFFVVLAYARFLRHADELTSAIHLRALALGLAAGFVLWPARVLLEKTGVEFGTMPILFMACTIFYIIGIVLWRRHYR